MQYSLVHTNLKIYCDKYRNVEDLSTLKKCKEKNFKNLENEMEENKV